MWTSTSTTFLLLLGIFGLLAASQSLKPLTLDEVKLRIDEFVVQQNGSQSAKADSCEGCSLACSFLASALPGQIAYPGSTVYNFQESTYWSTFQASNSPTCRFSPTKAVGVSLAVLTFQVTQCKFAVKSGGHAAFAGASNTDDGVTIDLVNLNQLAISSDGTETAVGAGNLWHDVYSYLEVKNRTVVGGRVSAIGVGGLTTGGGIAFVSGRYGWACDNVNKYEVVFADGTIHNVTYSSHPDLYFALRGGGNNFGIVTTFHYATYPQADFWGGSRTYLYSPETAAKMNNAFYWLNVNAPEDPYAQVILAYAYTASAGQYIIVPIMQHGKPVANPPSLKNFTEVPGAVADTLRIGNLTSMTLELNVSNPGGFRQTFWAVAVKNSPTLLTEIVAIFKEESDKVNDAAGIVSSVAIQGLPLNVIEKFSKNGGNALGITPADGPLAVLDITYSWSNAADDERILAAARAVTKRINDTANAQGLGHPFVYMNYATKEQSVIPSYGDENVAKLKATSKKYDPLGVWQVLTPGYHKLF
ncbi:related to 6-HYDROXY-D-NICOTINE OXIDASE [Rhynchosporium agropyri]|uniref:Related to 6-HYDROXY-D-NICOTINE OXIDASE n=1 Tax=Rhynchosporium agropyri TaxID=914238 RepID=A0A1E1L052_9HELO|nr:related to 6-HYDROXY-D-NICOTINE OXIDASE [Rhynchosporium agropyri]